MKLDTMRRYAEQEVVDAVVIGTGAGGAPILASLAEAGLKVVALEAGRHWEPRDHTPDELDAASIYWLGERLSGGRNPEAFGANNSGIGVGGSTLHWGAFCPRADPKDLSLHAESGQGRDWPLAYAQLAPYYSRIEQFIGVSGPASYPWDPQRRYPLGPVARNAPADAMAKGCEAMGIAAADAPVALVTRDWHQPDWGLRQACVNCGCCHQGCRNAAKASMDTTYLPYAVARGAEIRAESSALNFDFDSQGGITGVVYRQHGIEHRQRCSAVFLCGGAVESPRLLLNHGLANSSGQVGRNYMAHPATQVWGVFDDVMRMNRGFPASLISEDMLRPRDADFAGGYLMQSLGVLPIALAMSMAGTDDLWGARLMSLLSRYNHLAGIGINGDCLPSDENRLYLVDELDENGLRKARIDFSYGGNESALDRHSQKTMRSIWEAAGATDIFVLPRVAHTIGTCRMGVDAGDSVVNADCRSHDIANLWICDNSVFPSALAANPALTIMALALRSADRFLGRTAV